MPARSPFMQSDSPRSPSGQRRRQIQRRRATALAALGLLVLVVSIIVDGGSGTSRRTPPSPRAAERQRIHTAVSAARHRLAIPRVGDQEGTVARLGDRALDLLRGPEPGLEGGLALLDALVVDTRDRGGVSRSCRSDLHFHSGLSVP